MRTFAGFAVKTMNITSFCVDFWAANFMPLPHCEGGRLFFNATVSFTKPQIHKGADLVAASPRRAPLRGFTLKLVLLIVVRSSKRVMTKKATEVIRAHGASVTCTRMKRRLAPVLKTLSR